MKSNRNRRLRILVVDDMVDNAEIISATLLDLGYDVQTVESGTDALDLMESFSPDVVFLDLEMPHMSGFELAERIRARRAHGIRLIALTGSCGRAQRAQAERCGIDAFIAKPADRAEIEGSLRTEAADHHPGGGVSTRNTVRCAEAHFPNSSAKRRNVG